jgi:gliding motility-associated-like protein
LYGLSCYTCPAPVANPSQSTVYKVTVSNGGGCIATGIVSIDVSCGGIFIPTAFSPDESINNILYVRCDCISSMDFIIFDRWGNKVFESQNLNTGWDGTYKGQPMNTDTYIWYLDATLQDGISIEKKGNVTLVR